MIALKHILMLARSKGYMNRICLQITNYKANS